MTVVCSFWLLPSTPEVPGSCCVHIFFFTYPPFLYTLPTPYMETYQGYMTLVYLYTNVKAPDFEQVKNKQNRVKPCQYFHTCKLAQNWLNSQILQVNTIISYGALNKGYTYTWNMYSTSTQVACWQNFNPSQAHVECRRSPWSFVFS